MVSIFAPAPTLGSLRTQPEPHNKAQFYGFHFAPCRELDQLERRSPWPTLHLGLHQACARTPNVDTTPLVRSDTFEPFSNAIEQVSLSQSLVAFLVSLELVPSDLSQSNWTQSTLWIHNRRLSHRE